MPGYVLIVDIFGAMLAFAGFSMAFRQRAVRRFIGRPSPPATSIARANNEDDPITYILRIAGIMIMVFGIVMGGMVTLVNLR